MQRASPDFDDVRQFHLKFQLPADGPGTQAAPMEPDAIAFRLTFLKEERGEYVEAWDRHDLVKAADALFDFVYVAFGTALFMRAGPGFFPNMTWPSFDRTREAAARHGYLAGQPAAPHLMSDPLHRIIAGRMAHEIHLFEIAHASQDEPACVPLALTHLWNSAWAAYLGGAMMSLPWSECWRHVQAANMAKVRAAPDGSDSKRRSPWDVVKPAGWASPDAAIGRELVAAGADPSTVLAIARA